MEDTLNDDTANLHADLRLDRGGGGDVPSDAPTRPAQPDRRRVLPPKSDIGGSLSYSTAMKKIAQVDG